MMSLSCTCIGWEGDLPKTAKAFWGASCFFRRGHQSPRCGDLRVGNFEQRCFTAKQCTQDNLNCFNSKMPTRILLTICQRAATADEQHRSCSFCRRACMRRRRFHRAGVVDETDGRRTRTEIRRPDVCRHGIRAVDDAVEGYD